MGGLWQRQQRWLHPRHLLEQPLLAWWSIVLAGLPSARACVCGLGCVRGHAPSAQTAAWAPGAGRQGRSTPTTQPAGALLPPSPRAPTTQPAAGHLPPSCGLLTTQPAAGHLPPSCGSLTTQLLQEPGMPAVRAQRARRASGARGLTARVGGCVRGRTEARQGGCCAAASAGAAVKCALRPAAQRTSLVTHCNLLDCFGVHITLSSMCTTDRHTPCLWIPSLAEHSLPSALGICSQGACGSSAASLAA